jgi:adenosylcobinamide kinase/adenosylcobinamide-phosphate guanylyltransferase
MSPHELVLGGTKSGKSRCAEERARAWLARDATHRATLIATAIAGDDEMAVRIARHRDARTTRVPALETAEAPVELGAAIRALDSPARLLVIDCLTLWVTQCLMPPNAPSGFFDEPRWQRERAQFLEALEAATSPTLLVSNELGLGVMPITREARRCVDEIGALHQCLGRLCARVTLMVAGLEVRVRESA